MDSFDKVEKLKTLDEVKEKILFDVVFDEKNDNIGKVKIVAKHKDTNISILSMSYKIGKDIPKDKNVFDESLKITEDPVLCVYYHNDYYIWYTGSVLLGDGALDGDMAYAFKNMSIISDYITIMVSRVEYLEDMVELYKTNFNIPFTKRTNHTIRLHKDFIHTIS